MLTITLHANAKTGAGVNLEQDYAAFFEDFVPFGFPLTLPEEGEVQQYVHLDTPEKGMEQKARAVLIEGKNFEYTFSNHSVSGTIETVRLVRLGEAYNTGTGDLNLEDGLIKTASELITIEGFNIQNPAGVRGEVHEIIRGMMGGGPNGELVDADPLSAKVWAEGHRIEGSSGDDTYDGTKFRDIVKGGTGNDSLSGDKGRDKIEGGRGKDDIGGGDGADQLFGGRGYDVIRGGGGRDRIDGGHGIDTLTGGNGADRFVFSSAGQANKDKITDFGGADVINLRKIDADTTQAENQAFVFIGSSTFSGTAGELRAVTKEETTYVRGDLDGDGSSDFWIALSGAPSVDADNFLL